MADPVYEMGRAMRGNKARRIANLLRADVDALDALAEREWPTRTPTSKYFPQRKIMEAPDNQH